MSFAVWPEKPPFTFDKNDREQIYQVGDKWVVTDDPTLATQDAIDAVLDAPKPPPKLTVAGLVTALKAKGVLTDADIDGKALSAIA